MHPSIIPSFRRTTQEDYCESVISMGCIVRPCHKEKKGKKEGRGEGKKERERKMKERKKGSLGHRLFREKVLLISVL